MHSARHSNIYQNKFDFHYTLAIHSLYICYTFSFKFDFQYIFIIHSVPHSQTQHLTIRYLLDIQLQIQDHILRQDISQLRIRHTFSFTCNYFGTKTLKLRRLKICRKFALKNLESTNSLFEVAENDPRLRTRNKKVHEYKCNTKRYERSSLPFMAKLINSTIQLYCYVHLSSCGLWGSCLAYVLQGPASLLYAMPGSLPLYHP